MRGFTRFLRLFLIALTVAGCASHQAKEGSTERITVEAEEAWEVDNSCEEIDAEFYNIGLREARDEPRESTGKLAEHVLNRYLQEGEIVDSVRIESDIQAGLLIATLIGRISRTVRFAVTCASGWLVVVQERSNQYLGEGVTEDQFYQYIYLRVDEASELKARVTVSGKYRTFFVFPTEKTSESSYKFKSIGSDQQ